MAESVVASKFCGAFATWPAVGDDDGDDDVVGRVRAVGAVTAAEGVIDGVSCPKCVRAGGVGDAERVQAGVKSCAAN